MSEQQQLNSIIHMEPSSSPSPRASFVFKQVLDALRMMLKASINSLIDLIYPKVCVHCSRVGSSFCLFCQSEIVPFSSLQSQTPISTADGYTAVGSHTGALRSSIQALKYYNDKLQAEPLGALLAQSIKAQHWTFDMIIPVPMHLNRLKERGYNQAERIAYSLSLHLERQPMIEALQKIHHIDSQVGKSLFERQENVKDAFDIIPQYQDALLNKNILLIDDVCTTGATLQVCTAALRAAGVNAVYIATVSRAQGVGFDS